MDLTGAIKEHLERYGCSETLAAFAKECQQIDSSQTNPSKLEQKWKSLLSLHSQLRRLQAQLTATTTTTTTATATPSTPSRHSLASSPATTASPFSISLRIGRGTPRAPATGVRHLSSQIASLTSGSATVALAASLPTLYLCALVAPGSPSVILVSLSDATVVAHARHADTVTALCLSATAEAQPDAASASTTATPTPTTPQRSRPGGAAGDAEAATCVALRTGCADGVVRLWRQRSDTSTAHLTKATTSSPPGPEETLVVAHSLYGHDAAVAAVAPAPAGNTLSACVAGTLRLWSDTTGVCLRLLDTRAGRLAAALSLDDGTLVAGGSDKTLRVWRSPTSTTPIELLGHRGAIQVVSASPLSVERSPIRTDDGDAISDRQVVVSGARDGDLRVWTPSNGACIRVLAAHSSWVRSTAWHPDGHTLVSAGDDRRIAIWDLATAASSSPLLRVIDDAHSRFIMHVQFSTWHPLFLCSADVGGVVKSWRCG